MASLLEELINTLEREEKLYASLIPIEEDKIRAVIANDLRALERITGEEQKMVDEIGILENKREQVSLDMATVLGKRPGSINLQQIADSLDKQPEDQKRLREIHDKMRRTVDRMKELTAQNQDLLTQALEMVEYNINVMRSTRMSSGSSNYSNNAAQVDMFDEGAGMFDAKQ
ncbi:flagellar protein FlgN [Eubacterium xylanophilum]|uniref:flagellar protein FlgN n=1 Tax=Eubacterium xylanophilum TaxID=39497 RepID=UPI00047C48B5|nr:flagellar protein FlgN [Eubacterium xylanophilum]MCR5798280.1 flagellar protein FlgN [Eubacterium sp.]